MKQTSAAALAIKTPLSRLERICVAVKKYYLLGVFVQTPFSVWLMHLTYSIQDPTLKWVAYLSAASFLPAVQAVMSFFGMKAQLKLQSLSK